MLGSNEPFLAALRAADRRVRTIAATALDPWIHDLTADHPVRPTCGRCSWSWPCCCGRSTSRCAACRSGGANSHRLAAGWAGSAAAAERPGHGPRPRKGCSPPAAGSGGGDSRAAIRSTTTATAESEPGLNTVTAAGPTSAAPDAPAPAASTAPRPPAPSAPPSEPPAVRDPVSAPPEATPADTMARLREAKRRSRER